MKNKFFLILLSSFALSVFGMSLCAEQNSVSNVSSETIRGTDSVTAIPVGDGDECKFPYYVPGVAE